MGIIISTEKEMKWIHTEHHKQRFYFFLTLVTFVTMLYAFIIRILPENINKPIYWVTFLFAFLAFMISSMIYFKSKRYLRVIDALLEERRGT